MISIMHDTRKLLHFTLIQYALEKLSHFAAIVIKICVSNCNCGVTVQGSKFSPENLIE